MFVLSSNAEEFIRYQVSANPENFWHNPHRRSFLLSLVQLFFLVSFSIFYFSKMFYYFGGLSVCLSFSHLTSTRLFFLVLLFVERKLVYSHSFPMLDLTSTSSLSPWESDSLRLDLESTLSTLTTRGCHSSTVNVARSRQHHLVVAYKWAASIARTFQYPMKKKKKKHQQKKEN